VTCYFSTHLNEIFQKAGITVTKENKQQIDKTIQNIVKVKDRNCSEAWKKVKKRIAADEQGFVVELKAAMKKSSG
jgi:hypothetical protein